MPQDPQEGAAPPMAEIRYCHKPWLSEPAPPAQAQRAAQAASPAQWQLARLLVQRQQAQGQQAGALFSGPAAAQQQAPGPLAAV